MELLKNVYMPNNAHRRFFISTIDVVTLFSHIFPGSSFVPTEKRAFPDMTWHFMRVVQLNVIFKRDCLNQRNLALKPLATVIELIFWLFELWDVSNLLPTSHKMRIYMCTINEPLKTVSGRSYGLETEQLSLTTITLNKICSRFNRLQSRRFFFFDTSELGGNDSYLRNTLRLWRNTF